MLIDDWVATSEIEIREPEKVWGSESSPFSRDDRLRRASATLEAMKRAQPFVASPLVVETACGLAADMPAIKRSATYFFLPAAHTWIDLTASAPDGGIPGARHGVLLLGEDASIMKGEGMIVAFARTAPPGEPNWGDGGFVQVGFNFDLANADLGRPQFGAQSRTFALMGGRFDKLMAVVWATIALINTPRLSYVQEADLSRLNKARMRQNKPPILQHKIVSILIDRGELGIGFQQNSTEQRPLHHVRAFLRIKRGKVELVRPHWRGNPRFGVVVHRYVALREEDEAGPWKGGPAPPPKVIKELE